MSSRPFIEARLRVNVHVPQAEERLTAGQEDSIEVATNQGAYNRGVETAGGVVTNFVEGDEVIFDLNDDVASLRELQIIQEEVIEAFSNVIDIEIESENIVIKADTITVFPMM